MRALILSIVRHASLGGETPLLYDEFEALRKAN
jgi:hypothetical protein